MALSLRRPTLDESNLVYTSIMIGWGAVIGSAISFMLSGAIIWAFFRLYQRRIVLPSRREILWIGGAFILFFLSETLAGVVSFSGYQTLKQIVENLPFLGFLFIYARLALSRREDVLRAVEIGAVSGAFATLALGLFQAAVLGYPWTRVEGMTGNPGPFALVAAVLYCITLVTAVHRRDRMREIALLAALAAAGALILSGMRSLWPILVLAPLVPLFVFRSRIGRAAFGRIALLACVAALLLGYLSYDIVQPRVAVIAEDYARIVHQSDYDNSLGQRLKMWRVGLEVAAEKPIFGRGPGEVMNLPEEAGEGGRGEPVYTYTHFHNFLVNAMVRSGIVGLAAVLFMLVLPVWICASRPRDDIGDFGFAMLLLLELSYVLSGLFGIMLGHDIADTLFIYGIIAASFLVLGGEVPGRLDADAQRPVGPRP